MPYRPRRRRSGPSNDPGLRGALRQDPARLRQYCWNVWTLTNYDFHHYAIDDAMYLTQLGCRRHRHRIGFTLGTPDEESLASTATASWRSESGDLRLDRHLARGPYDWSTLDPDDATGSQGVAPWASPGTVPVGVALVRPRWQRGISQAREATRCGDRGTTRPPGSVQWPRKASGAANRRRHE